MNSLVSIASYSNSLQANIVKGRLLAENIPATLANEQYINADWLLSNALGGVQIQVPAEYEQQARELIESIDNGQFDVSDDNKIDQLLCPVCQSEDIQSNNIFWKTSFIVTNTLHIPLPFSQHAYSCKQCQHEWSEESDKAYSIGTILFYIVMLTVIFSAVIDALFLLRGFL